MANRYILCLVEVPSDVGVAEAKEYMPIRLTPTDTHASVPSLSGDPRPLMEKQMQDTSTWSTTSQRFAPGNFVTTWNPDLGRDAVGVTRAVENPYEANPRVLVKWLHDLSQEWVRSEYLHLSEAEG